MAINCFECDFALEITCFMIGDRVHLSFVKLSNVVSTSSFVLLLVKCNTYVTN